MDRAMMISQTVNASFKGVMIRQKLLFEVDFVSITD